MQLTVRYGPQSAITAKPSRVCAYIVLERWRVYQKPSSNTRPPTGELGVATTWFVSPVFFEFDFEINVNDSVIIALKASKRIYLVFIFVSFSDLAMNCSL